MLLISCRKNFTGTTDLSDFDEFREILKPQLKPFTTLTEQQFLARTANKKCLVLVHGYRNEAAAAVKAYWTLADRAKAAGIVFDEVVGYLWPGGWSVFSFHAAVIRANWSGKRFERNLLALAKAGATVDVQTHSLGARVAMEALDRGQARARNVHLTAPAIDNESIEQTEIYEDGVRACSSLYIFHSKNDKVLKRAYRIGDFPEFDRALGYKGPQHPKKILPNTKIIDCQDVVTDHGGYRDSPEYYAYWKQEFSGAASAQFTRLKKQQ